MSSDPFAPYRTAGLVLAGAKIENEIAYASPWWGGVADVEDLEAGREEGEEETVADYANELRFLGIGREAAIEALSIGAVFQLATRISGNLINRVAPARDGCCLVCERSVFGGEPIHAPALIVRNRETGDLGVLCAACAAANSVTLAALAGGLSTPGAPLPDAAAAIDQIILRVGALDPAGMVPRQLLLLAGDAASRLDTRESADASRDFYRMTRGIRVVPASGVLDRLKRLRMAQP